MSCSRRHFIAGMGAVIAMTGSSRVIAKEKTTDRGVRYVMVQDKMRPVWHEHEILNSHTVRYGMVHDETRCIGCYACAQACQEVNKVPESVTRISVVRSGPIGDFPNAKYHFVRNSCEQCDNPPCVTVCPSGAAYRDPKTGIIDVKRELCVGCQYCIAACPYRVRFIHPVDGLPDKCNFCRDTNLAKGKLPACVLACPTKALTFGDLDDPNSEVNAVLASKNSYRIKEPLGTEPKVYRIPFQHREIKG